MESFLRHFRSLWSGVAALLAPVQPMQLRGSARRSLAHHGDRTGTFCLLALLCLALLATTSSFAQNVKPKVKFRQTISETHTVVEGQTIRIPYRLNPTARTGDKLYFRVLHPSERESTCDEVDAYFPLDDATAIGERGARGEYGTRTHADYEVNDTANGGFPIGLQQGQAGGNIEIAIKTDRSYEGDEYFLVVVDDDENGITRDYGAADCSFERWAHIYNRVRITDATAPPVVSLGNISVAEGRTTDVVVARDMHQTTVDSQVQTSVTLSMRPSTPESARRNSDYVHKENHILRFTSGGVTAAWSSSFNVETIQDDIDESVETYEIRIAKVENATIKPGSEVVTVTIRDDDPTALVFDPVARTIGEGRTDTIELKLARPLVAGEKVVVPLDIGGAAELGVDYRLSAPATIPEGVAYARLWSTESARPPTVTFTGPSAQAAPIVLKALADTALDEGNENIVIRYHLSALRTEGFSGGDGIVHKTDAGNNPVEHSTVVQITNLAQTPVVSLPESVAGPEGSTLDFSVRLSTAFTGSRTIPVAWTVRSLAGDTATADRDYRRESGIVEFHQGETRKVIQVPTFADGSDEEEERFSVSIALVDSTSAAAAVLGRSVAKGVIQAPQTDRVVSISTMGSGHGVFTEGSDVSLMVRLSRPAPVGGVRVFYRTADGRGFADDDALEVARAGEDYTAPPPGTSILIPSGRREGMIRIRTLVDDVTEREHYFRVRLTSATHAGLDALANQVVVPIADDGTAMPALSVSNATAVEGGDLTFVVTKSGAAHTDDISFSWRTVDAAGDGAAVAGDDYTAASATVTLGAAASTHDIVVSTTTDAVAEPDETLRLLLTPGAGVKLVPGKRWATGTILDDDLQPGAAAKPVRIVSAVGRESTGGMALDFEGDPTGVMYVTQAKSGQSNVAGRPPAETANTSTGCQSAGTDFTAREDFTKSPGDYDSVELNGGEHRHLFPDFGVVCDDDIDEPTEYREFEFFNVGWGHGGRAAQNQGNRFREAITARFEDDDPTNVYLTVVSDTLYDTSFNMNLSDFTPIAEEDRTGTGQDHYADILIDLADSSGINHDNAGVRDDARRRVLLAGEQLVVPLHILGGVLGEHYGLELRRFNGSGTADPQYGVTLDKNRGVVTFTGYGTTRPSAQTAIRNRSRARIRLRALTDANSTDEILVVSLPHSHLRGSPPMRATGLGGGAVRRMRPDTAQRTVPPRRDQGPNRHDIILKDRHGPPATAISVSVADASAAEGTVATFAVSLSKAAKQPVVVLWDASGAQGDTADAGSDYRIASGKLVFAAGETRKDIEITTLGDAVDENDETFTVVLSGITGANAGDDRATGTITAPPSRFAQVALAAGASTLEGDTIRLEVKLTKPAPSSGTRVVWRTVDGRGGGGDPDLAIARKGQDYTEVTGRSMIVVPGQSTAGITVQTTADDVFEGPHRFTVELVSVDDAEGAALDPVLSRVVVEIDDSGDQPVFSIEPASAVEGEDLDFIVTRTGDTPLETSVFWSTADDAVVSATSNVDYQAVTSRELVFPADETRKRITVASTPDDDDEDDETFVVNLQAGRNAGLDPAFSSALGTILNDDITYSIEDVSAPEGTALRFRVVRSRPFGPHDGNRFSEDLSWGVINDSGPGAATPSVDYDRPARTTGDRIRFYNFPLQAEGVVLNERFIEIPTILDDVDDDGETVTLQLRFITRRDPFTNLVIESGVKVKRNVAVGTIRAPPTRTAVIAPAAGSKRVKGGEEDLEFTVSLSHPAPAGGTRVAYDVGAVSPSDGVQYAYSSSAHFVRPPESASIVIPQGQKQGTITVPTRTWNPGVYDAARGVRVRLQSVDGFTVVTQPWQETDAVVEDADPAPTFSIAAGSAFEGDAVEWTVVKSGGTTVPATLHWRTSDETPASAVAGTHYTSENAGELVFAPDAVSMIARVSTVDDAEFNADRTFQVELESATDGTIDPSAASATGTIRNNDRGLAIADSVASEGTVARFRVTLSAAIAGLDPPPVTVDWVADSIGADTATAGTDYEQARGSLTFEPGETEKFVEVATYVDSVSDTGEVFTVTLSNAKGAVMSDAAATGRIAAPAARLARITAPAAPVAEGGTARFTVSLSSPAPAGGVRISHETIDGRGRTADLPHQVATADADYTPAVAGASLEIREGAQSGTIAVPVLDDDEFEKSHWFTVRLVAGTGTDISAAAAAAIAEITDDEDKPRFTVSDTAVIEGAATPSFAITKTGSTHHPATVLWETADSSPLSAVAGTDYRTASRTPVHFAADETEKAVLLGTNDNAADEQNRTFEVVLSAGTDGVLGASSTATVTLLDDDATGLNLQLAGSNLTDEGDTRELVLTLSRKLETGEKVIIPLVVSGRVITPGDYSISLDTDSTRNKGVSLMTDSPHSTASPAVVMDGPEAEVAHLKLKIIDDSVYESREYMRIDPGSASRAVSSNLDRTTGFGPDGINPTNSALATVNSPDSANHGRLYTLIILEDMVSGSLLTMKFTDGVKRTTEGKSETFRVEGIDIIPRVTSLDRHVSYNVEQVVGESLNADRVGPDSVRALGTSAGVGSTYAGSFTIATEADQVSEPDAAYKVVMEDNGTYSLGTPTTVLVLVKDDDPFTIALGRDETDPVYETQSAEFEVALVRPLATKAEIDQGSIVEVGEEVVVPLQVDGLAAGTWELDLKTGSGVNQGVALLTSSPWSTSRPALQFSGAGAETAMLAFTPKSTAVSGATPVKVAVKAGPGAVSGNLNVTPTVSGSAAFDVYDEAFLSTGSTGPVIKIEAVETEIERVAEATASFLLTADASAESDITINLGIATYQVNNDALQWPTPLQDFSGSGYLTSFSKGNVPLLRSQTGADKSITLPRGMTSVRLDLPVSRVGVDAYPGTVHVTVRGGSEYRVPGAEGDRFALVAVRDVEKTPVGLVLRGPATLGPDACDRNDSSNGSDNCIHFDIDLGPGARAKSSYYEAMAYEADLAITGAGISSGDYSLYRQYGQGDITQTATGYTISNNTPTSAGGHSEVYFQPFQFVLDTVPTTPGTIEIGLAEMRSNFNEASAFDLTTDGTTISGSPLEIVYGQEPMMIVGASASTLSEGGSTSYTIEPNQAPDTDVEVTVLAGHGLEVRGPGGSYAESATLTFTAQNGTNARTVEVRYPEDATDHPRRSGMIAHRVAQAAGTRGFDATDAETVELELIDNDVTQVSLALQDSVMYEGAGSTPLFTIDTGRPLAAGESVEVPVSLRFSGTVGSWEVEAPAGAGLSGVTYCGGSEPGTACSDNPVVVTFEGPSSRIVPFGLSVSDMDREDAAGTLGIPASSRSGGSQVLVPSGLDGGVEGIRVGDGQFQIIDPDYYEATVVDGGTPGRVDAGERIEQTIVLSRPAGPGGVTVRYALEEPRETADENLPELRGLSFAVRGEHFSGTRRSVRFRQGESRKTVTPSTLLDEFYDGPVWFRFSLIPNSAVTLPDGAWKTSRAWIIDDDEQKPKLRIVAGDSVAEGEIWTVGLIRDGFTRRNITAKYRIVLGEESPMSASEEELVSTVLNAENTATILADDNKQGSSGTLTTNIIEDSDDEFNEAFFVEITDEGPHATVDPEDRRVAVFIIDDDRTSVTLGTGAQIAAGVPLKAIEGGSALTVPLSLSRPLMAGEKITVPINLATNNPTANRCLALTYAACIDTSNDTASTAPDYFLGLPDEMPDGVTVENWLSSNPQVVFTGPSARALNLTVTAYDDGKSESGDSFALRVGSISASGFGEPITPPGRHFTVTVPDSQNTSQLSLAAATATEGQPARFRVALTSAPTGGNTVTVDYATSTESDDAAVAGRDYRAAGGTLTFRAGETLKTVDVQTYADAADDDGETFTLTLSNAGGANIGSASAKGTIAAAANARTVSIAAPAADSPARFEGKAFPLTVRLSEPAGSDVIVSYETQDGSGTTDPSLDSAAQRDAIARAGEDYRAPVAGAYVVIPAGGSEAVIPIQTIDDNRFEGAHAFRVRLVSASNAGLDGTAYEAVATINDDADKPNFRIADASALEGDQLEFVITRSKSNSASVSIDWQTRNASPASATAGSDYTVVASTALVFAANETSQTVTVSTAEDTASEPDETFEVSIEAGEDGYVPPGGGVATGTILDDDTQVSGITLRSATGSESSGVITLDFQGDPGAADMRVTQRRLGDTLEQTHPDMSGRQLAATDFRGACGTFTQNGETLQYDLAAKEDFQKNDYEYLTLTAGRKRHRFEFGMVCEGGNIDEPTEYRRMKFFDIDPSNPGSVGQGQNYKDEYVVVRIDDDDPTHVHLAVDQGAKTATEGGGDYATIEVNLSKDGTLAAGSERSLVAGEELKIPLRLARAKLNEDYSLSLHGPAPGISLDGKTGVLTFTGQGTALDSSREAARSEAVIRVTALADADTDSETVQVSLPGSSSYTSTDQEGRPLGGGVVSVQDSDAAMRRITLTDAGVLVSAVSVADGSAGEGEAIRFAVTLDQASAVPVSVSWRTADSVPLSAEAGKDYAMASGTLRFEPGETEQAIEVVTLGDALDDADETFAVVLTGAGSATLADSTAVGTIRAPSGILASLALAPGTSRAEGDAILFNVELTEAAPQGGLTVIWQTVDGRGMGNDPGHLVARGGEDYTPIALGAGQILAGQTSAGLLVQTSDDDIYEGPHYFTVRLVSIAGAGIEAKTSSVVVAIDDQADLPSFSVAPASGVEGDAIEFTVTRTGDTLRDASVQWTTADTLPVSARAGQDYMAVSPTVLAFAPQETSKTVSVQTLEDALPEATETFSVRLQGAVDAVIDTARADALGTLRDDDVGLSIADASVQEGGLMRMRVALAGAASRLITADWATADESPVSAQAGRDYVAATGTLVFKVGETEKFVDVVTLADSTSDAGETFAVRLSNVQGVTVTDAEAVATIQAPPGRLVSAVGPVMVTEGDKAQISLQLSAQAPGGGVTVRYRTRDGAGTAESALLPQVAVDGADYTGVASGSVTIAAGSRSATVEVQTTDDSTYEGTHEFSLVLVSATGALVNASEGTAVVQIDDAADRPEFSVVGARAVEGEPVRFTVTRSGTTVAPAELTWKTANTNPLSAEGGKDYVAVTSATLAFGVSDSSRTLEVATIEDRVSDEGEETFTVAISASSGAVIAAAAGSATGTIVDDDISVSIADATIPEGSLGNFRVTLSRAPLTNETVKVSWRTTTRSTDTATAGVDYTASSGILTFKEGETEQYAAVTTLADDVDDADETFAVALSNPQGASIAGSQAVGTIVAPAPVLATVVRAREKTYDEGGRLDFVSVCLRRRLQAGSRFPTRQKMDGMTVLTRRTGWRLPASTITPGAVRSSSSRARERRISRFSPSRMMCINASSG